MIRLPFDLPEDSFIYLASPYAHYAGGIERAFHDIRIVAADFIKSGIPIYSPIAHHHPIARIGGIDPLDLDIWLPIDRPIMRAAALLIVVMLPGWKKSAGTRAEIDHFTAAGKPVLYFDPEEGIFE